MALGKLLKTQSLSYIILKTGIIINSNGVKCENVFKVLGRVSDTWSAINYFIIVKLLSGCQLMVQPSNKPISKHWLTTYDMLRIKGQGSGNKTYCRTMLIGCFEPELCWTIWDDNPRRRSQLEKSWHFLLNKQEGGFVIMFAIWREEPNHDCFPIPKIRYRAWHMVGNLQANCGQRDTNVYAYMLLCLHACSVAQSCPTLLWPGEL